MRTTRWIAAAMVAAALAAGAVDVGTAEALSVATFGEATVVGGTPEQVKMAGWAVGRFEAAGLTLPTVDIRFHTGLEG